MSCGVRFFLLVILTTASTLSITAAEPATPITQKDFADEQLQQDMQRLDERLTECLPEHLTDQARIINDRLAKQDSNIGLLNIFLAGFALLITVMGVIAGFAGYFTVSIKAKKEARESAQTWFAENASEISRQMQAFQSRIDELIQQSDHATGQFLRDLEKQQNEIQKRMTPVSPEQSRTALIEAMPADQPDPLKERADALQQKPEAAYTFQDWDTRAFASYNANDLTAALHYWQQAMKVSGGASVDLARVLNNIAYIHAALGDHVQAIKHYAEVVARFKEVDESGIRNWVANAYFGKSFSLVASGRYDEAIANYDEALSHCSMEGAPELTAKALYGKGVVLGQMSNSAAALEAYAEVERYRDAAEPEVREWVAKALYNKGVVLGQMGDYAAALEAYAEVLRRYRDAAEPEVREWLASAQHNKGHVLAQLGRYDEAIAAYATLERDFGHEPGAAFRKLIAYAWNNRGAALLYLAKQRWDDAAWRRSHVSEALVWFDKAASAEAHDDKPLVWCRQAYGRFLQGESGGETGAAVRALLQQALESGGERIYQEVQRDLQVSPVPLDAEFSVFLEAVWSVCVKKKPS